ncbi:dachshund homolog 1-like [Xenentodon cancila]
MAGSFLRTSSTHSDQLFHFDTPHSTPHSASTPQLPGALRSVSGVHADCRLVDVHGAKVASFTVDGLELICLPQVFELFLKNLVGGLHTVYTKLKRLDIRPAVCTVEQVRALRGLGAIQPGVNRCKLISRADFDTLYRDCTTASSRPGRPPKRTLGGTNLTDCSRLLPHNLLSPALLPQTGLTGAAAMVEALKLQKMRMMMHFHGSSNHQQHQQQLEMEDDDAVLNEGTWEKEQCLPAPPSLAVVPPAGSLARRALQQHSSLLANRLSDLPFMMMSHPLLPVGLPPASVALTVNQMSQLGSLTNTAATPRTEESQDSVTRSPAPSKDELHPKQPTSQSSCKESSCSSSSSLAPEHTQELDDCILPLPVLKLTNDKLPLRSQSPLVNNTNAMFAPLLLAEGLSSMETLLTNVQGLLKVAVECTHSQNKEKQLERAELKLELDREQHVRQTIQKRLSSEFQMRVLLQRRLKKEKRAKRRLQEVLEFESRRREEVERTLLFTDAATPESKRENHQLETLEITVTMTLHPFRWNFTWAEPLPQPNPDRRVFDDFIGSHFIQENLTADGEEELRC